MKVDRLKEIDMNIKKQKEDLTRVDHYKDYKFDEQYILRIAELTMARTRRSKSHSRIYGDHTKSRNKDYQEALERVSK